MTFRLGEFGELEAAVEELVGRRRRKREHLNVPALELGEAAAGSDLGLEQADIALGRHDLRFDALKRRALRCDAKRHEVAAKRRSGATGDHEYRAETARAHCRLAFHAG